MRERIPTGNGAPTSEQCRESPKRYLISKPYAERTAAQSNPVNVN